MNQSLFAYLVLISPLVFVLTAILSWFQKGIHPSLVKKAASVSSIASILIAAVSGFFVVLYGDLESPLLGVDELGLSVRLDSLSVLMLLMIALIAFIVLRFSQNYLDGDARHGVFMGRLAATIASVQLLVLSGNLSLLFISWVLTSMSLHRLLVFYQDRPGAVIAARKKFIVARLGDLCLLLAFLLLYAEVGSGNLEVIFQTIQTKISSGTTLVYIEGAALFLVLAALLKSAQFPTHGWLIEVMETPTPVSALLHAGLLNAGPFLIVRMAYVMEASTIAPMILLAVGGFTALFASVVFLTQTSVKTALGYSSVAHMGFSLLTCGLGLYPAAMLHLVSHSFYKAHAFLSSGSVIEVIRAGKVKSSTRTGSPLLIGIGILTALVIYAGFAWLWGINPQNELSLLVLGAVIVMGLARLATSAFDSNGSFKLKVQTSILLVLVTVTFFSLESGFHHMLSAQVPELVNPNSGELVLLAILLLAFGITVFGQILAPTLTKKPGYQALAIHLRNGLYANALFDRVVRALYTHHPKKNPVLKGEVNETTSEKVFLTENQLA
ncbi:proton-conducting transporter membrane subunit [Algoriphagus sp.]|uniref:proton-conducting transporter transmembrane domain-containing protein n=1 Tax=Algoriphagus sp. TaxID=1872435 RepID=UPI003296CDEE